jgi:hypothetical protein
MTNLSVKTITGLYVGLSAVACYFLLHAAITGKQLLNTNSAASTTQTLRVQGGGTSSTTGSNTAGSSSGSSSPSSDQSGSGSLASQQSNETSNWAGYASRGGTFTTISGSWKVPTASTSDETAADATWIGIGGISSSDLIQVGTQNIVTADGQIETSAFYEMLPDASQTATTITVNPGDSVTASITELSAGQWRITLSDTTKGGLFSTDVAYASSESSAEWIEEDPSDGNNQQIPLDDFGNVNFTDATTTVNGTTESALKASAAVVTMVNGSQESLADVSNLSSDGESFSVTRTSALTGSSIAAFNNDPDGWVRQGSGMGGYRYGYGHSRYLEEYYGY